MPTVPGTPGTTPTTPGSPGVTTPGTTPPKTTQPGTPGTTYGPLVDPIVRAVGTAYNGEVRRATLVPYMDVAYPQAAPYDMLANAQSMAAGKMSVADFLKASQKGWATYHGYSG